MDVTRAWIDGAFHWCLLGVTGERARAIDEWTSTRHCHVQANAPQPIFLADAIEVFALLVPPYFYLCWLVHFV